MLLVGSGLSPTLNSNIKGESYLAEQFRQIARYLAEHLTQKNDILFNEKFLTLWMQECNYTGMQVCKYASMQVSKRANRQVYKYAKKSIQLRKYVSI